uniref:Uncharacterized protein n=1 Tax=Daphnia galeata TaxID=27404 RepID=A0A8J2WJT5_9CRUS|nr:unnamed protein product [Daphnia galeata]
MDVFGNSLHLPEVRLLLPMEIARNTIGPDERSRIFCYPESTCSWSGTFVHNECKAIVFYTRSFSNLVFSFQWSNDIAFSFGLPSVGITRQKGTLEREKCQRRF